MKKRTGEDRIMTLPNILSMSRILMIPFIILTFVWKEYYLSTAFIILSGLTDLFDGYIARKYGEVTKLGKSLDPVADKLTQGVILIGLILKFPFTWITLTIFLLKEFSMLAFFFVLYSDENEYGGALIYGKLTTIVFYIAMILLFLFPKMPGALSSMLMYITTVALIFSWVAHMIEYSFQYKRLKKRGI